MRSGRLITIAGILCLLGASCARPQLKTVAPANLPPLPKDHYFDASFREAWNLLGQGQLEAAREALLGSRVALAPLDAAHSMLQMRQGRSDLAQRSLLRAEQEDPDHPLVLLARAFMLEQSESWKEAWQAYVRMQERGMNDIWVGEALGRNRQRYFESVRQKLGGMDVTAPAYFESLSELLAASPEEERAVWEERLQSDATRAGRLDLLIPLLEKKLNQKPEDMDLLRALVEAHARAKRPDLAMAICHRMLRLEPGQVWAINRLAELKRDLQYLDIPQAFAEIFNRDTLTREALAAMIGHLYGNVLGEPQRWLIIPDAVSSFARDAIVKLCSLEILPTLPDHQLGRKEEVSRGELVLVLARLRDHLEAQGRSIRPARIREDVVLADVPRENRYYETYLRMVRESWVDLDDQGRLLPTEKVSPYDALNLLRRIRVGMGEPDTSEPGNVPLPADGQGGGAA